LTKVLVAPGDLGLALVRLVARHRAQALSPAQENVGLRRLGQEENQDDRSEADDPQRLQSYAREFRRRSVKV
jgi:hypothetical protein